MSFQQRFVYFCAFRAYVTVFLLLSLCVCSSLEERKVVADIVECELLYILLSCFFPPPMCPLSTPLGGAHRLPLSGYQII